MEEDQYQSVLKALGAFDYIAANKLIPKLAKIYYPIGSIFTRLSSCESSFTQLQFLRSRWFVVRKDTSVEMVYTNLAQEIPKEIVHINSVTWLSPEDRHELVTMMEALRNLCLVRREMISIYQAILAQSSKGEFDEILKEVEIVQAKMEDMNLSSSLLLLGVGLEKEIHVLYCILKARTSVTNYSLQDTCIALYKGKQGLAEWKKICQEQDYPEKTSSKAENTKETSSLWRFSIFSQLDTKSASHKQGDIWPNTIRWYIQVLDNLAAKMTLYFNQILVEKQSIISEEDPEKALWKGIRIDYYDQICTFKKKQGADSVSLIYEVTSDTSFYPQGYICPNSSYQQPQGVHSFPFIFSHPKEPPTKYLPSIISIIQGSQHKLNDPKAGPVHFMDPTVGSTFYLMRIDRHVVFLIIFSEKTHSEPATIEFMTHIVTSLRGSTVIEKMLRID
ncbi:hypothetical protein A0J61_01225 [Choanephora cucurbitarum]|uniref:Uncharacterized protein n=1 Tax=Choanephora cucurbitarum TaxID=101091 RepID=A0A1C7NNL5_9FUNG|nr:hypothetical protein A0J61_01225 [Choanephora cucurbitarum]